MKPQQTFAQHRLLEINYPFFPPPPAYAIIQSLQTNIQALAQRQSVAVAHTKRQEVGDGCLVSIFLAFRTRSTK